MTTRRKLYRVWLEELYIFDLKVDAISGAEVDKKVEAFYDQHRKPPKEYRQEGLTAILKDNSTFLTFRGGVQLHAYNVYELYAAATSLTAAIKKAEAFYAEYRKPKAKYQQEGLAAALKGKSVHCMQWPGGQWACENCQAAARDSERDAAKAA